MRQKKKKGEEYWVSGRIPVLIYLLTGGSLSNYQSTFLNCADMFFAAEFLFPLEYISLLLTPSLLTQGPPIFLVWVRLLVELHNRTVSFVIPGFHQLMEGLGKARC